MWDKQFVWMRNLVERWIQHLAADARNTQIMLEVNDQRNMLINIKLSDRLLGQKMQSIFTKKKHISQSRYGKKHRRSPSIRPSKTSQRSSGHVWLLVVDILNTSCVGVSGLLDNDYLRVDLVKSFFFTFCWFTGFFNYKKTMGRLTKTYITFVLFWNI